MPRFVILTHDHPFFHWDLMFEQTECLKTWRLLQAPDEERAIEAEQLPDHRLHYLNYEGPVSGNRGTVERWDAGEYSLEEDSENRWHVRLKGRRLIGRACLEVDDSTGKWLFRMLPDAS